MVLDFSKDNFVKNATDFLEKEIRKLYKSKGTSSVNIALSGGQTPLPLYENLAKAKISWKNINVFIVDERCVNESHKDSNFGQIKKIFSKTECTIIKFYDPQMSIEENMERYERLINEKTRNTTTNPPVLDLIVLGMGTDGHTASLFPHEESLDTNDNIIFSKPENASHTRLSLGYSVLFAAKKLVLIIRGEEKRKLLKKISESEADYHQYPISRVIKNTRLTILKETDV